MKNDFGMYATSLAFSIGFIIAVITTCKCGTTVSRVKAKWFFRSWLGVFGWQTFLWFMFGESPFLNVQSLFEWMAYLITPAYVIALPLGAWTPGTMRLFSGLLALALLSVAALIVKSLRWSLLLNVVVVVVYLTGSICTALAMPTITGFLSCDWNWMSVFLSTFTIGFVIGDGFACQCETAVRYVKLKRLLMCCIGAVGWEIFLMLMIVGRPFADDLPLVGWISYLNTPGYAIMLAWGVRTWGPMHPCEPRWILGLALLSVLALRALVAKDLKSNLFWNVILVAIYLISSVFVVCNMIEMIT